MKTDRGLSLKAEAFCRALAEGYTQAGAYRRAYPESKAKPESVWEASSSLAADPMVRSRVQELLDEAAKQSVFKVRDILEELRRIAVADPRKAIGPDGKLVPLQDMDAATAAAISAIEVDDKGLVKVKFWSKTEALDKAMRHLGQFDKDNRQLGNPLRELAAALSGNVVGPKGLAGDDGDDGDKDGD